MSELEHKDVLGTSEPRLRLTMDSPFMYYGAPYSSYSRFTPFYGAPGDEPQSVSHDRSALSPELAFSPFSYAYNPGSLDTPYTGAPRDGPSPSADFGADSQPQAPGFEPSALSPAAMLVPPASAYSAPGFPTGAYPASTYLMSSYGSPVYSPHPAPGSQEASSVDDTASQSVWQFPRTAGPSPPAAPPGPLWSLPNPAIAHWEGQILPLQALATMETPRTVYIGNLPGDASVDELLSLVRYGPLEHVKIVPEKYCAFISFLDPANAEAFYAEATTRQLSLNDRELKFGWGRPTKILQNVIAAVVQAKATRNVYIGSLDESTSETDLRDEFSHFGPIDQVKVIRDKGIAFVHFLSIMTAVKVVQSLSGSSSRRVSFGRDRCSYVSSQQIQAAQAQAQAASYYSPYYPYPYSFAQQEGAPGNAHAAGSATGSPAVTDFTPPSSSSKNTGEPAAPGESHPAYPKISLDTRSAYQAPVASVPTPVDFPMSPSYGDYGTWGSSPYAPHPFTANRTIYLGNLSPECTVTDICNVVRGGIVQVVRYLPEKHIAFITFMDSIGALNFFHMSQTHNFSILNRRLKVGWGRPSNAPSAHLTLAVQSGASRNVYIGNLPESFTEDKLYEDFCPFGEIELINRLPERKCAFVNFTNLANALRCVTAMKENPEYHSFKINFGKDRCAGPARFHRQRPDSGSRHSAPPVERSASAHTDAPGVNVSTLE